MADAKPKDAIALLKQDHREVLEMFEQFENAKDDKKKKELATSICMELTIHTMLEEEKRAMAALCPLPSSCGGGSTPEVPQRSR